MFIFNLLSYLLRFKLLSTSFFIYKLFLLMNKHYIKILIHIFFRFIDFLKKYFPTFRTGFYCAERQTLFRSSYLTWGKCNE